MKDELGKDGDSGVGRMSQAEGRAIAKAHNQPRA